MVFFPARAVFALFVLAAALSAPASASELDAAFDIMRKGAPIGYHAVHIEEDAGETTVETRIRMRVKFGPIVVFHYDLASTEIWRDGAPVSIDSKTDRNGRDMVLTVRRDGDALTVDGTSYKGDAPLGAIPGSYWNKKIVAAPVLLNTQNGSLVPVTGERLDDGPTPAGAVAEHYRLKGSVTLDLWYDGDKWVGADFTVNGEDLSYALMDEARRDGLFAEIGFDTR